MKLLRKRFASPIRRILHSRYSLFFVNGFLLASLLYFYIEDSYEKQLFKAMGGYVREKTRLTKKNEENLLLQSVHLTWYLGQTRYFIFQNKGIRSVESLIQPVTVDLMTTNGACGSYAYILSSLLCELKIPNRIAQMKVGDIDGGHILVEAKTSKGWVVLDASYDLVFRKPDGSFASFDDVKNNWNYYSKQVPDNYDYRCRYQDVRYTNWNKIPILMPFLENVLSFFIGKERVKVYSIRTLFLRKFKVLFQITALIYLALLFIVFRRFYLAKRKALNIQFADFFSAKRISSMVADESIK